MLFFYNLKMCVITYSTLFHFSVNQGGHIDKQFTKKMEQHNKYYKWLLLLEAVHKSMILMHLVITACLMKLIVFYPYMFTCMNGHAIFF